MKLSLIIPLPGVYFLHQLRSHVHNSELAQQDGRGKKSGGGRGGGGVGLRVGGKTLCDKISLTIILYERILRKTSLSFDQIFL